MRLVALKILLTTPVAFGLSYPFWQQNNGNGVLTDVSAVDVPVAVGTISVFLFSVFLYCRDLQSVLVLMRPESRICTPRSVWWMFLIPYNFIEDFFIVYNISRSLENESRRNKKLAVLKGFGFVPGIGWCFMQILSIVPNEFGMISAIVAVPIWAVHWVYIKKAIGILKLENRRIDNSLA